MREYHGRIDLTWPWTARVAGGVKPPIWALELQLQIQHRISNTIMASCYWLGRLLLGIQGSYAEFTSAPEQYAALDKEDSAGNERIILKVQ